MHMVAVRVAGESSSMGVTLMCDPLVAGAVAETVNGGGALVALQAAGFATACWQVAVPRLVAALRQVAALFLPLFRQLSHAHLNP